MPSIIHKEDWAKSLRRQVKALSPGWAVAENRGRVWLRVRPKEGQGKSVTLPFKWNELTAGDAYTRIRNIYGLVGEGYPLDEAAKIAAGEKPKLTQENDWQGVLIPYRESLTNVSDKQWEKKHLPVLNIAIDILQRKNAPSNGADLVDAALRKWVNTPVMFVQQRNALFKYLRYCVYRKQFMAHWLPPDVAPVPRKPKKKRDGYPLTDSQILRLLDSLPEDGNHSRWKFGLMLMAVYGLRPEDLRYLKTRNSGKELWTIYRKSKGGNKGATTEPRKLSPLFLRDEEGQPIDWKLLQRFHIGEKLPPLGQPGNAGDAIRNYLKRRQVWQVLWKEADAEGQDLVPYSFRHRYSAQSHAMGIPAKKIADAMGHTLNTHNDHYARFQAKDIDKAYEEANAITT